MDETDDPLASHSAHRMLEKNAFQNVYRFGHSSDFSLLFSKNNDDLQDYLIGVLVVALMLAVVFLCWGLVLIICKHCMGPERVGFLSGAPFRARVNGQGTTKAIANPWIYRGRWIFAISINLFILFAIVLAASGMGFLANVTSDIGNGARVGRDTMATAETLLQTVVGLVAIIQRKKGEILQQLQDFYQAIVLAKRAKELGNMQVAVGILVESLKDVGEGISSTPVLKEIVQTLDKGAQTLDTVYVVTTTADIRALQAAMGVALTIVPALLLGCLYWNIDHGSHKRNAMVTNVRSCILWPIFIFQVTCSILFCVIISIVGILNSDFCSGGEDLSPDSTILEIVVQLGYAQDSLEYRAVAYLVSQCGTFDTIYTENEGEPLVGDTNVLKQYLNNTLSDIDLTFQQIREAGGLKALANETGFNATIITEQLEDFRPIMDRAVAKLAAFAVSLPCRPMYKLYSLATHKAACTAAYQLSFWMFVSLLFMSFFGLVAVTFRSALYPVAIDDEKQATEEFATPYLQEEIDNDAIVPHHGAGANEAADDDNSVGSYFGDDEPGTSTLPTQDAPMKKRKARGSGNTIAVNVV